MADIEDQVDPAGPTVPPTFVVPPAIAAAGDELSLTLSWPAGGHPVINLAGEFEETTWDGVQSAAALILRLGPPRLTLDLSSTRSLSARGVSCLARVAAEARRGGVRLALRNSPQTARILSAQLDGQLSDVDMRTLDGAEPPAPRTPTVSAPAAPPATTRSDTEQPDTQADPTAELARLREQVADLRVALHTRPLIAEALGVLRERYRFADSGRAFDLLRRASQRHHIKVRTLANAVLAISPPERVDRWFPARVRGPAPELSLLPRSRSTDRTLVLETALTAALGCVATEQGDLHVVDPHRGGLDLEIARGLTRACTDYFAHVTRDQGCVNAHALRQRVTVRVPDVADDVILSDERGRAVLLAERVHAAHSIPLVSRGAHPRVLGVLSLYHPSTDRTFTEDQSERLAGIAAELASWLDWHYRTVVLDALEHLHTLARQPS